MADDHGVGPTRVHWDTRALDHGVRHERLALDPETDLRITPIADGETQQDRVVAMDRLRDVWLGLACLAEMNLWNGPAPPWEPITGPNGFRHAQLKIAALCRYSVDQFQASRLVAPEELFETSLLKT